MQGNESRYWGGTITLGLPFWIMDDRFDSQNGNMIENALFNIPGCKSVCLNHQCWVEFDYSGDMEAYQSYAGKVKREVDAVLSKARQ